MEVNAPITAPVETPVVETPVVAPATTAPAAQEFQPIAPVEGATMVPHGTVAKLAELAETGDSAAREQWLASQPEELREKLREALDGGDVTIQDMDPTGTDKAQDLSMILPEELDNLESLRNDPNLGERIRLMQNELLGMNEELEKAQGTLPEPMKRLLTDPVVKARLEEVSSGKSFVPQALDEESIGIMVDQLVQANDMAGLRELISDVVKAVPEVILEQRAQLQLDMEQKQAQAQEALRVNSYLASGFNELERLPEFQSKEPPMIQGALNPEHPGAAFALWLEDSMKTRGLTLDLIDDMGGLKAVAYTWLAKQKGGMGQLVASAGVRGREAYIASLNASRAKLLEKNGVKPSVGMNSAASAVRVHGVDIARAQTDPRGYGASAIAHLTGAQKVEVANAMEAYTPGV